MRYVLAPFKYVLGKFWIWAGGILYLGGDLLLGGRDYTYMHPWCFRLHSARPYLSPTWHAMEARSVQRGARRALRPQPSMPNTRDFADIIYVHVYLYTCIFTYTYIHMYTYINIFVYTYTHVHIHIYIYICVHTYIYIYVYMYVCMHAWHGMARHGTARHGTAWHIM